MIQVPLSRGYFAKIDDCDADLISHYKWHADPVGNGRFYATTRIGKKGVRMHRMIADSAGAPRVDHVNGDTLDNQRRNLRACSHQQNLMNQKKRCDAQTSRFKGVSYRANRGTWRARIKAGGREVTLGSFATEIEAAVAYNAAAAKYFGEFARLNDVGTFAVSG